MPSACVSDSTNPFSLFDQGGPTNAPESQTALVNNNNNTNLQAFQLIVARYLLGQGQTALGCTATSKS